MRRPAKQAREPRDRNPQTTGQAGDRNETRHGKPNDRITHTSGSEAQRPIKIRHGLQQSPWCQPHRAHTTRRPRLTGEAQSAQEPTSPSPPNPAHGAPAAARRMPPLLSHLKCPTLAPPKASRTQRRSPSNASGVPSSTIRTRPKPHTTKAQNALQARHAPPKTARPPQVANPGTA